MMRPIKELLRPNIAKLTPYSSARNEFTGEASIFLDANENPFRSPLNRYPDPYQKALKAKISKLKQVPTNQIFIGNGSDEPIDLLIRAFCEPAIDEILTIDPSYGMYQVAADIHNIHIHKVPLTDDFQLRTDELLLAARPNTKLLFLCSPNNPSGNSFPMADMEKVIKRFEGIVVLDEAYIDYATNPGLLGRLPEFSNLVILQTFSKAWGMAGIRLGMAFANPEIVQILNRIKYPYNLNVLTQAKAIELLDSEDLVTQWIETTRTEREHLTVALQRLCCVSKVFPSDANFLLVRTTNPTDIYNYLVSQKIIVRNRNTVALCEGCIRITIGTPEENQQLIQALENYGAI